MKAKDYGVIFADDVMTVVDETKVLQRMILKLEEVIMELKWYKSIWKMKFGKL